MSNDRIFRKFSYNDGQEKQLVILESAVKQELANIARTRPYLTEGQITEAMNDVEYWLCKKDGFDYWEDEDEKEIGPYDRIIYNPRTGNYELPNMLGIQLTIPRQTFHDEIERAMKQHNLDREEAQSMVITSKYWVKKYEQLGTSIWEALSS